MEPHITEVRYRDAAAEMRWGMPEVHPASESDDIQQHRGVL